jgi:uncharacterized membrane protein YkoI
MKIMKKKMLTFGLIGLVSLGTTVGAFASTNNQGTTGDTNKTAIEQADDKEVNDDASIINANVKLTEAEAATIALSSVDPNAKVVKVELQDENGTFAYGIDMILNNKKIEVNVDANTGVLIKNGTDSDTQGENDAESETVIVNANVKLTEAEASKIALSSADSNAKVVKVELQDENGTFAYGIDMIVNNKKLEVNVDANSGQIVASDNNQENNDNDQEINDDNQAVNNNTDDQEIND